MNNKRKNNVVASVEELSLPSAQRALNIIWVIGLWCSVVILFFFFKPFKTEATVGPYSIGENRERLNDFISIDQLLLSSDESSLTDKKSFVNGALRFQWRNHEPDLNEGHNRIILYDNILKKKLQKVPKADDADFSVRPVPR